MTALRLRVRHHGRIATVRGIEIESIEESATVSRVPGSQFGMALVRGQIIAVLRLGDMEGCLIVGRARGEIMGIAGLEVVDFELVRDEVEQASSAFATNEYHADSQGFVPGIAGDFDLDIDACIARATTTHRHPSQPTED